MAFHALIMAGGKGERLWPVSRDDMPKQLLSFDGKKSLLRNTFERIEPLCGDANIYVGTGKDIAQAVYEQLPELPYENILIEPVGRNTAPCIGFAAAVISKKDPEGIMGVFPSDHLIKDNDRFRQVVSFASESIASYPEMLVTLGIIPASPETGFGYIAPEKVLLEREGIKLQKVGRFHEKPNLENARRYIQEGFFWNAGMFIWRVDSILKEFEINLNKMRSQIKTLSENISEGAVESYYNAVESVSIDFGVMEKSENVAVIPSDFGWDDIGSWDALGKVLDKDNDGNAVMGDAFIEDAKNNVIWSGGKKIVAIGLENIVVVEGKDAILVCPRDRAQDVSKVVKKLKK